MQWAREFFEVDLDKVQLPEIDQNWSRTKSYERKQVEQWIHQLGHVQALSREQGRAYEHFQRLRSSDDPRERDLGQTHHKFYDHATEGAGANRAGARAAGCCPLCRKLISKSPFASSSPQPSPCCLVGISGQGVIVSRSSGRQAFDE